MSEERNVHPYCRNASNQYHECTGYCFRVVAEEKLRMQQYQPMLHFKEMCHFLKELINDEVVHFVLTQMEAIYNLQELEYSRLGKVLADSENELKVLKVKEAKLKKGYEDAILALKKSMEENSSLQEIARNN